MLATTQHDRKTLVIDSFTKLFNTQIAISAEAMEKAGKEDAFGASKKQAIAYTRRMISWFNKLDMNVVLICHQKSLWKDGKEVGVTFDGWDKLEYELHLALRIAKQGASRKAFIGKTRLVPFPEGESFDWSYQEFAKRYGQDVMETGAKPADLATADQGCRPSSSWMRPSARSWRPRIHPRWSAPRSRNGLPGCVARTRRRHPRPRPPNHPTIPRNHSCNSHPRQNHKSARNRLSRKASTTSPW
jgi:hypothetical protein